MQIIQSYHQVTLHINVFGGDSYNFSDIIQHHNINEQETSISRKFQYPKAALHIFLTRDQHKKSCLEHYSKANLYYLHRLSVELQGEFKILAFKKCLTSFASESNNIHHVVL